MTQSVRFKYVPGVAGTMRKDLIDILCCPDDKARLELHGGKEDDAGEVVSGHLKCTKCGFDYPIEEGIPNLLPREYHTA